MTGALRAATIAVAFVSTACGGGVDSAAEKNHTFYASETSSREILRSLEDHYPPLDVAPAYRGVSVLEGNVRLSRPADWVLRTAGGSPGSRYVQYLSPKEYIFAIYEWSDRAGMPWRDVIAQYEAAGQAEHADIVFGRVPMATGNAQGRAFVVRRKVPGQDGPYENTAREFLLRNSNRIVLVQIVHQGVSLAPESDELLHVVETLQLK